MEKTWRCRFLAGCGVTRSDAPAAATAACSSLALEAAAPRIRRCRGRKALTVTTTAASTASITRSGQVAGVGR